MMETKECHNDSTDVRKTPVKWPIAPDGYIPNSVIRGWMRILKVRKGQQQLDSNKDGYNEDNYTGYYKEDYRGLRDQRRAKKNEERSYTECDYQPGLSERFAQEDDKDHDKNKDSSRLVGVKGKRGGRLGFGFAFERKWPEGAVNETNSREEVVNEMETTDNSGIESKKETAVDTTKQDKTVQDADRDVKMPFVLKESHNIQTEPADLSNQKLQNQQTALVRILDKIRPNADSPKINIQPKTTYVNNQLQTTNDESNIQPQETKTEFIPAESRQNDSGKVQGKMTLVSEPTYNNEREAEVPQSDLREAKDASDETKPSSKLVELINAPVKPPVELPVEPLVERPTEPPVDCSVVLVDTVTPRTEPWSPSPSPQLKPPETDQNHQPVIFESKTLESKFTRDPKLMLVDQKVLRLYKQFKTGKWVSSKAHGTQFSTESRPSSCRSKRPNTETLSEDLGTAESKYQHGSGEKTKVGAPLPIEETGLWKQIMEGVTESVDQAALWRLVRDRPTEILDQTSPGGFSRVTTTESMDQAGLRGLTGDRPTKTMTHTGLEGLGLGRVRRETTTEAIDVVGLSGLIGSRPTKTMIQTGLGRLGPSVVVSRERTTESKVQAGLVETDKSTHSRTWNLRQTEMQSTVQTGPGEINLMDRSQDFQFPEFQRLKSVTGPGGTDLERPDESIHSGPCCLGTRGLSEFMTQAGPGGQGLGRPTEFTVQTEALGLRPTASQSTVPTGPGINLSRSHDSPVFQGLQSKGQAGPGGVSPERLTEFMTRSGSNRLGVHEFTEAITQSGLGGLGTERPESVIQIGPSGVSTERLTKFITQTGRERLEAERPTESTSRTGTWGLSETASQLNVQTGPGETNLTSRSHDSQSVIQIGPERLVTKRPAESLPHTRPGEQSMGGPAVSKDQTGLCGQIIQTSIQSTVQTGPRDMGTSGSHDLAGLETVQSMAHTPGFLSSSDPEQFLKALSKQRHRDQHSHRPMPKWRERLYQLIFLYGFCSAQTARLLASEQHGKSSQIKNQHEAQTEADQLWEPILSAVHERVVRRVQFQDISAQAFSDFHCVIPLPSLNNFITLEKYGETEYGKLLFEWKRGDEEEDQMKVVSNSVTV